MTPSSAPAVKGWRFVRSDRGCDTLVYVYERADGPASVPSAAKFGGGGMTVGYSNGGKTMTVKVRQTARE